MVGSSRKKDKVRSKRHRFPQQHRQWWSYILALVLLAVALYLIPEQFERLALFALVAVTMAYAIFTHAQAEASKKMIEEMKEQRLAASQPIIIQKAEHKLGDLHIGDGELPSNYFSHFIIWNAGDGPAIEVEISLLDEQRNPLYSHRETFMRAGEQRKFLPNLADRLESKYYLACEYKRIFSVAGDETRDQTWLPFELLKASKEGEMYVRPGELEFRFRVPKEELIDVFGSQHKLR